MKILTIEEKLKIAVDFIKKISEFEPKHDYIVDEYGDDRSIINTSEITKFKDMAWHVLAELTE